MDGLGPICKGYHSAEELVHISGSLHPTEPVVRTLVTLAADQEAGGPSWRVPG